MDNNLFLKRFHYDGCSLIWLKIKEESWRDRAWNSRYANKKAGTISKKKSGNAYLRVWLGDEKYYAHRIIWILLNGAIPDGMEIDHIDGDGLNNKIENLRLVTAAENRKNAPISSKNKTGCTGVSWDSNRKKWCSIIGIGGRVRHIGYFDDFHEAVVARRHAERDFGFHHNHGRKKK